LVAIYRSPSYSPLQHRVNDTAIMDATVERLAAQGWRAIKTTEREVEQGRLPTAPLRTSFPPAGTGCVVS